MDKKVILITGASSGIGRETALELAKQGYFVFAGVRRKIDKAEIENLHADIKGVYIDITVQSSIDKAYSFISKYTDKVDVLINNAGIAVASPIEFLDIKRLKEQFDVNTFGAVAVVQKFLPLLNNAKIINISSFASYGIFPFLSPYCASKRALDILMNSFSLENKNNIKVISVKPCSIKTPIWKKSVQKVEIAFNSLNEADKDKYKKEFEFLKKQALKSFENGLDIYKVTEKILEIIKDKNPKPSYNVGVKSFLADIFSKCPQSFINYVIKLILKQITK